MGIPVRTFSGAGEFLQSPGRSKAACLIVDVQMPGMDGLELQERLLALGHRLPIIFITAYPGAKVRGRGGCGGISGQAICNPGADPVHGGRLGPQVALSSSRLPAYTKV